MIRFLKSKCFKLVAILLLCLLKSHSVLSACSDDEWYCDDGSCIPMRKKCDGIADCMDRSDEIAENCIHLYRVCQEIGFPCTYGACITKTGRCNQIQDCSDNSDELVCERDLQGHCGEDKIQCLTSKQCIAKELACDGHRDCSDGTDETVEVCAEHICPENGFHCGYGGCISEDARCNGTVECIDGSDEAWQLCGTPRKTLGIHFNSNSAPALQHTNGGVTCKIPDGLNGLKVTLLNSGAQLAAGSLVNDDETVQAKCTNRNDESIDLLCFGGKWQGQFPICSALKTNFIGHISASPGDKSFLRGISTSYVCHQNGIHDRAWCNPSILPNTTINVFCASGYQRIPSKIQQLQCLPDGKLNEKRLPCEQHCGQLTPAHRALTKNAFPIIPSDAPWHVAIFENFNGELTHICGGSIISPRLIITAAHCFWNKTVPKSPHLYRIIAGKQTNMYYDHSNEGLPQEIAVEKIYMSEIYEDVSNHFYADIALLKLTSSLIYNENVSALCMHDARGDSQDYVYSNIIGSISGYGSSGTLERLSMATLSYELCKDSKNISTLAFDKFCLRNENVNTTLCRGDSGGGFVVKRGGAYYLLGIVSYTPETRHDCVTSNFVVMSNVRQMRPDLRDVWEREIKNDQELF